MPNSGLTKVISEALLCPSITQEELGFLHELHLRLISAAEVFVSPGERNQVSEIVKKQCAREAQMCIERHELLAGDEADNRRS